MSFRAERKDPGKKDESTSAHGVALSFRVERRDLFWIYFDMWAGRLVILVGILLLMGGLSYGDPSAVVWFLAFVVFALVGITLEAMYLTRTGALVGTVVHVRIDQHGIRGWPVWPEIDRSWASIRGIKRRGGVLVLQVGRTEFSVRLWICVPERVLTSDTIGALSSVLASEGRRLPKWEGFMHEVFKRTALTRHWLGDWADGAPLES